MSCEFDAPNNFITTVLSPSALGLLQAQSSQFAYLRVLRDRMYRCEQSLELPCLIDGAGLNRGQMSEYAEAVGSWVSATEQVVNFVYQQSINGTSSNCWISSTDCSDASLRCWHWRRLSIYRSNIWKCIRTVPLECNVTMSLNICRQCKLHTLPEICRSFSSIPNKCSLTQKLRQCTLHIELSNRECL